MGILAAKPRHRLEGLVCEAHLHDVGVLTNLDLMTDEPRGDGIGSFANGDRTPPPHRPRVGRIARNPRPRERGQTRSLLWRRLLDAAVSMLLDQFAHEHEIGLLALEFVAPTHDE